MTYETITIAELASMQMINDVDDNKVNEIVESIATNGWIYDAPAILFYGNEKEAITGSHRIAAAQKLVEIDEANDYDTNYSDIEIYAIDVSEYIENYFSNNEDVELQCDNLRPIFENTDMEDEAKLNVEY